MKFNWNKFSEYRGQIYGISILLIMGLHIVSLYDKFLEQPWVSSEIFQNGGVGVDAFLFLSGISMYFAMIKNQEKGEGIWSFYKRRLTKILKIYVFFCLPFLAAMYLIYEKSASKFFSQVFFLDIHGNRFWFLICIIICYLLYPLVYMFIKNNKNIYLWIALAAYIVFLFGIRHYTPNFYENVERMITRFPIWLIGCLCGKKVYDKREMSPYLLIALIGLLIMRGPIFHIFKQFSWYKDYSNLLSRLYMGVEGVGFMALAVIILEYCKETKINRALTFAGTITLEAYVIHIALRDILLKWFNMKLTTESQVWIFVVLFVSTSLLLGYVLHRILYGERRQLSETAKVDK